MSQWYSTFWDQMCVSLIMCSCFTCVFVCIQKIVVSINVFQLQDWCVSQCHSHLYWLHRQICFLSALHKSMLSTEEMAEFNNCYSANWEWTYSLSELIALKRESSPVWNVWFFENETLPSITTTQFHSTNKNNTKEFNWLMQTQRLGGTYWQLHSKVA